MTVSVIIPVYNEEKTVQTVLRDLLKIKIIHEIIIVNDGSTDKTVHEIKKVKHPKVKLHTQKNSGKGGAILKALEHVTGEYVLIQDADLEYHPEDIPKLMEPFAKQRNITVVYGSRFLGPHANLLFWHSVGNRFINLLTNVMYNTTISDLETCYKLIPTSVMKELKLQRKDFGIEVEITCKLLRKKHRIYEVPISYFGRDFSEGKKITWVDGIKALWLIFRYRFSDE